MVNCQPWNSATAPPKAPLWPSWGCDKSQLTWKEMTSSASRKEFRCSFCRVFSWVLGLDQLQRQSSTHLLPCRPTEPFLAARALDQPCRFCVNAFSKTVSKYLQRSSKVHIPLPLHGMDGMGWWHGQFESVSAGGSHGREECDEQQQLQNARGQQRVQDANRPRQRWHSLFKKRSEEKHRKTMKDSLIKT